MVSRVQYQVETNKSKLILTLNRQRTLLKMFGKDNHM